jgi:hypothetical protein
MLRSPLEVGEIITSMRKHNMTDNYLQVIFGEVIEPGGAMTSRNQRLRSRKPEPRTRAGHPKVPLRAPHLPDDKLVKVWIVTFDGLWQRPVAAMGPPARHFHRGIAPIASKLARHLSYKSRR